MRTIGVEPPTTSALTPNGSVHVGPLVCPDGKLNNTGPRNSFSEVAQHVTNRRIAAGLITAGKFPEHNRARVGEQSGLRRLREHSVNSIRPLADVFDEQHTAFRRIECPRCAHRRHQLRERAAGENPRRRSLMKRLELRGPHVACRFARHHDPAKGVLVVRRRPFGNPAIDHRTMDRGHSLAGIQGQDRGDVAVADQRLARGAQNVRIEKRQELRAAIAATDRDERRYRRIFQGTENRARPRFDWSRDEPILLKDGLVVDRLETETRQFRDAGLDLFRGERTGRSHKRDTIAGSQSAEADHKYAAISAATS